MTPWLFTFFVMLCLDSDDDSGIAYGCQSEPHIADYKHGDEPIDCRTGDVEMRYQLAYDVLSTCVCLSVWA